MGMVDALRAATKAVRRRGEIVDLRPAPGIEPRVLARGRVVGHLVTRELAVGDDAAADASVERAIALGLVRRVDRGHLWYQVGFADLADLAEYLRWSNRFGAEGLPSRTRARLAAHRSEAVTLRRALAYQVLAPA